MASKILRTLFPGAYSDRDQRQKEILSALPELSRHYTPDEYNQIVRQYVEGDLLQVPTKRSMLLAPSEGTDVSSRSTKDEPISFNPRGFSDEAVLNLLSKEVITPESLGLKRGTRIKTVEPKPEPKPKDIVTVDTDKNEMTNLGQVSPNAEVITKKPAGAASRAGGGSRSGGGAGSPMTTAELQRAIDSLTSRLANEIPGTDEYKAIEAELIPFREEQNRRLDQSRPKPKPAAGKPGVKPVAKPGMGNKSQGQGKQLTKDVVAKYLKAAGGNMAKAKEMAKRDGYKF